VLGTAASPALRGIADQEGVTLVDDCNPTGIARTLESIVPRPRPVPQLLEWSTAARTFLSGLNRAESEA
jgi:hypothetical protein